MAVKLKTLSLVRIGGASRELRAAWSLGTASVTKKFRASKNGSVAAHEKKMASVTQSYRVIWSYTVYDASGKTRTITASTTTVNGTNATFTPPEEALTVTVSVTPIAKTYTYYPKKGDSGTKSSSWYSGAAKSAKISTGAANPTIPTIGSMDVSGNILSVSVASEDAYVVAYQLQVYQAGRLLKTDLVTTTTSKASFNVANLAWGYAYAVRARIQNERGAWSDWSALSNSRLLAPPAPAYAPSVSATANGALVTWAAVLGASDYVLQYTSAASRDEAVRLFAQGAASEISTSLTSAVIPELDAGTRYYFRYRAANDAGDGPWGPVTNQAFTFGTAPTAPTVWSDANVVIKGTSAHLHWLHNTTDGSEQTSAELEIVGADAISISGAGSDMEYPTATVADGASIQWRVRTKGAADIWSPWSETQTIRVWELPTLSVSVPMLVDKLPVNITVDPNASSQAPIVADVEICAANDHMATKPDGTLYDVLANERVWSAHFASPEVPLSIALGPGDVHLEDGQEYILRGKCAMSSGLVCENSVGFTYDIDYADIALGAEVRSANDYGVEISPWALDQEQRNDGTPNYLKTIIFDIYRIDADGSLVHLAKGMPNTGTYSFIDMHAPFGRQIYRVVATDTTTGALSFEDELVHLNARNSLCFSWNDESHIYYADEDDEGFTPSTSERVLELPGGITLTESSEGDRMGREFIGDRYPDSSYGTQLGTTLSCSAEFFKGDETEIALVRELEVWMGDVYVREPMGGGFWAMVSTSISASKDSPVVTASFQVTRIRRTDACEVYA